MSGSRQTCLTGILVGACRWQERQCKDSVHRKCPFCLCLVADREHLWRECPATSEVRANLGDACGQRSHLPIETRMNGHVLLGLAERRRQAHDLRAFEVWSRDIIAAIEERRTVIVGDLCTDGSCKPANDARRRAGGWAVVCRPISGGRHTVPRAEIQTVVAATVVALDPNFFFTKDELGANQGDPSTQTQRPTKRSLFQSTHRHTSKPIYY